MFGKFEFHSMDVVGDIHNVLAVEAFYMVMGNPVNCRDLYNVDWKSSLSEILALLMFC